MTDRPPDRKDHIRRYIGTNAKGEKLTDIWADMYRIDEYPTKVNGAPGQDGKRANDQVVNRLVHWNDDPKVYNEADIDPETIDMIKLISEDEDPDNPREWIEIPAMKIVENHSSILSATGNGDDQAKSVKFYNPDNNSSGTSRVGRIVEVTHKDTNIDKNPNFKYGGVIEYKDYKKDDKSEDKSQKILACIVLSYQVMESHATPTGQGADQLKTNTLANEFLIEEFKIAPDKEAPPFNPPWMWDPLQILYNVSFGSLAVEFYPHTSYVKLVTELPDASKFSLVIWFRVPQSSIDAAHQEWLNWVDHGVGTLPPFTGIIPIGTAGPPTKLKDVDETASHEELARTSGGFYTWAGAPLGGWLLTTPFDNVYAQDVPGFTGGTTTIDPSYIGIDCRGDNPVLAVNIVMPRSDVPTITGIFPKMVSAIAGVPGELFQAAPSDDITYYTDPVTGDIQMDLVTVGNPIPTHQSDDVDATGTNGPVLLGQYPEAYRTTKSTAAWQDQGDPTFTPPTITGNHWHCLMLSLDASKRVRAAGAHVVKQAISDQHGPAVDYTVISGSDATYETMGSRVTSASRMFIALDDTNLTNKQLSTYHPAGYADANAILPVNAFTVAMATTFELTTQSPAKFGRIFQAHRLERLPEYQYDPSAIPFSHGFLSFPAHPDYLSGTKHIELGECSVYFGDATDWSSLFARRAWLTKDGEPESISKMKDFMGRDPDVFMHGSGNWKKARDIGAIATAAAESSGGKLAEGVTGGEIDTYRPNPNLNDEQGPSQ